MRVLFLAGLGRSGTTLLEQALGQLPGVQPLGEVIHLWHRSLVHDEACGCGQRFSRCEFWQGVGQRAFGGWDNVDVEAVEAARRKAIRLRRIPAVARGRLPATDSARLVAGMHRRIYEAAGSVSGARAVVDSSKHPALAYALRCDRDIDLRVVHVVRDARGVAYSWTKRVERPEGAGRPAARWMTRYTPARSALLWLGHNACLAPLPALGTKVMLVTYESFIAKPRAVLRAIASFAHLDIPDEALGFASDSAVTLAPAHTASGNPLRFTSGRLRLELDEAWRSDMPASERFLVTALAYVQLARYGYIAPRVRRP
jgi:hypothetical protein